MRLFVVESIKLLGIVSLSAFFLLTVGEVDFPLLEEEGAGVAAAGAGAGAAASAGFLLGGMYGVVPSLLWFVEIWFSRANHAHATHDTQTHAQNHIPMRTQHFDTRSRQLQRC